MNTGVRERERGGGFEHDSGTLGTIATALNLSSLRSSAALFISYIWIYEWVFVRLSDRRWDK
jgi:hypothetical protein